MPDGTPRILRHRAYGLLFQPAPTCGGAGACRYYTTYGHLFVKPSHTRKGAIAVYRAVNSMRTLREILDGTGLPRYRIARRAGISPSTLILWERDGIPPKRIDVYTRLAQVLGVEPRELLELAHGGDTRE